MVNGEAFLAVNEHTVIIENGLRNIVRKKTTDEQQEAHMLQYLSNSVNAVIGGTTPNTTGQTVVFKCGPACQIRISPEKAFPDASRYKHVCRCFSNHLQCILSQSKATGFKIEYVTCQKCSPLPASNEDDGEEDSKKQQDEEMTDKSAPDEEAQLKVNPVIVDFGKFISGFLRNRRLTQQFMAKELQPKQKIADPKCQRDFAEKHGIEL